jgi:hypothetical protein
MVVVVYLDNRGERFSSPINARVVDARLIRRFPAPAHGFPSLAMSAQASIQDMRATSTVVVPMK